MVETKSAAIVAHSGKSSESRKIGSGNATIPKAASLSGWNRGISFIASTIPSSAPAPSEPNSAPATRELSSNSSKASTGRAAESIEPNMFRNTAARPIRQSSASRVRKRSPARTPFASSV